MSTLGSDKEGSCDARVPLSGKQLEAAVLALETPAFREKLAARIMKLARQKGFHSPFDDEMNLPGGKSAGDLAGDIVEKALEGSYTWDYSKQPNFLYFCLSRAESILSNWLEKSERLETMSPLFEDDDASGEVGANPVNTATNRVDIYAILRWRDGGNLADQFLQDFALNLPDGSHEQLIVMAVHDDRECAGRKYCLSKLKISEGEYDAAIKRILRRLPAFRDEWIRENDVTPTDWEEAR